MSDQKSYDMLGVDENSSFEEIQDARNRLVKECGGDRKQIEAIEAAYDAILMDRLRQRQEGKIKVPDRIRFPERQAPDSLPELKAPRAQQAPPWLERLIDTPSRADILWPAGALLGAGLFAVTAPSFALALGVACSIYFLNRKEKKFGRSLLLTFGGLILGVLIGQQIGNLLASQLQSLGLGAETFASFMTLFLLWLISSFLR
jgi:hypothetical protein